MNTKDLSQFYQSHKYKVSNTSSLFVQNHQYTEIIFCMRLANERQRYTFYNVTLSPIGWAQNDPWIWHEIWSQNVTMLYTCAVTEVVSFNDKALAQDTI